MYPNSDMRPLYTTEPLFKNGRMVDVCIHRDGRIQRLAGSRGAEDEVRRIADLPANALPVVLGSGLGLGLAHILESTPGPVAVIDREIEILRLTKVREHPGANERVFWIDATDPETALTQLTHWQMIHDGRPFAPILTPFYARLDPAYYRFLADHLAASQKADFWTSARYPKFAQTMPRILLVTSTYFLMGEVQAACNRLGYATSLVQLPSQEIGSQEFVEQMLSEILRFHPDFVLTINHLGVDKEGILTNLLAHLRLPLASWFVDNPHLILYLYENLASDWITLFTWDADNISSLKSQGFASVHYLPLGTDPYRFTLCPADLVRDVAFVGNSMVHKVRAKLDYHDFPTALVADLHALGHAFKTSGALSVATFLEQERPALLPDFHALPDMDIRLAYETLITWQATLDYRLERVVELLPFAPMIVGDQGWHDLLPASGWTYHPELNYYAELPHFYPATRINFNCTSQQMKGAVNQRVFDVPASGSFVLTDHRRQIEDLFVPGEEIICYEDTEEIADLIRYYLTHDSARARVITAGRRRILAEHTYDLRLAALTRIMRQTYG